MSRFNQSVHHSIVNISIFKSGDFMSSRFGAASSKRGKNAKLKIILGSVVFLLVILLLALVWVLQNNQPVVGTEQVQAVEPINSVPSDSVGILIPLFRIEAGTKLTDEMFKDSFMPSAQVPIGAMLSTQRNQIFEKYAARLINPNVALLKEDVADSQPLNTIEIPAGYRLITILVDNRSGVEGYAKAGSRVDVLWTFPQDGKKKIATLARFVKVISLGGVSQSAGETERVQVAENKSTTVSLLVTEKQAKYLELARSTGELSLVLVGGTEPPPNLDAEPEIIDADKMLGVPRLQEEEQPTDGTLYVGNDKYILIGGKWKKDKSAQ